MTLIEVKNFLEQNINYKTPASSKATIIKYFKNSKLDQESQELVNKAIRDLDWWINYDKKKLTNYINNKPRYRGGFGSDVMDHFPYRG